MRAMPDQAYRTGGVGNRATGRGVCDGGLGAKRRRSPMPAPELTVVSSETRDGAVVDDVLFDGPDGSPVEAFLVRPADDDACSPAGPAILFWHWFDTQAPDGDRTQYLDEATGLARLGATSLLPGGRFPWAAPPTGAAADVSAIEAEAGRLHAGSALLRLLPDLDRA